MPKKVLKTEPVYEEEPAKSGNSFFDYLRFGESYTSLILGIIVVIISTALLLSFFNNRNATPNNTVTQDAQSIAQISQRALQLTVTPQETGTVDNEAAQTGPSTTVAPTTQPTAKPTTAPTAKPTEAKKVAQATTAPTKAPAKEETKITAPSAGEYTVKAGDNLWTIAERQYKSGYNWVDIARANNLSNPGQITVNQKLKLPKVTAKAPTGTNVAQKEQNNTSNVANKITGNSYKVVKGDSLWTVAVRAYGNGYKWTEIAKANKLANPGVIHPGNTLNLPRGK